jgi:hypothetical protein
MAANFAKLPELLRGTPPISDLADVTKARTWLGSPEMKTVMEKSGVVGSPSIRFAAEMCDFSLQSVRSRAAKVGDKLVTCDFGTGTRGFAAADDPELAVCVMPGTELAFTREVACLSAGLLGWEDEDKHNQPPDGNLSTGQQGQSGRTSRCARISGWADRVADTAVRGSGGNSAAAACAASDRG